MSRLKKAQLLPGEETLHFFASKEHVLNWKRRRPGSSGAPKMAQACLLKGCSLIAFRLLPHGVDHPDPDVGEGTDRDTMAFAVFAFALIVVQGPSPALGGLPGKLMRGVAQRFNTGMSSVNPAVGSALEDDRRGPSQGLQTGCICIAFPVVADFCQQPRSQALASSRQALKDLAVGMTQKKVFNHFLIGGDLLAQTQQPRGQSPHQTRFGPRCDRIVHELWLMQTLKDLGSHFGSRSMTSLLEDCLDLLDRRRLSCLQGGIGLQKGQRRTLLKLGEEIQSHRVIGFETSSELVHQTRLHLDQSILVTGEHFEFSNFLAIWGERAQFGKIPRPVLASK